MLRSMLILLLLIFQTLFIGCSNNKPTDQKVEKKAEKNGEMKAFMGIPWGSTIEYFKTNFKEKHKMDDSNPSEIVLWSYRLGETEISFIRLLFTECPKEQMCFDSVIMSFKTEGYDSILETFKTKYGPPDRMDNQEVSNAFGAKFNQQMATWEDPLLKRVIMLSKFSENITDGAAVFVPSKAFSEADLKAKAKAKKGANQL